MRTIDLIAAWLRREGTRYLFCFPTTAVIEACAQAGVQPIICRQERVGVGIADGYSRVTNGATPGVFAMRAILLAGAAGPRRRVVSPHINRGARTTDRVPRPRGPMSVLGP
jgi:hypothetical protein